MAASHYQYTPHSQAHSAGLAPPSLNVNPSFMNPGTSINPFQVNGNSLNLGGAFNAPGLGVGNGTGLASNEAQMRFAHGASLQAQQAHNGMGEQATRGPQPTKKIVEVWQHNLEQEVSILRRLIDKYTYVTVDTQFPGIVARPMGLFNGKTDYHYQTLRCNVDLLNIIQVGITLFDKDGKEPRPTSDADFEAGSYNAAGRRVGNQSGRSQFPCTWQFNFKFSLDDDMFASSCVDALTQAGVNFELLKTQGIDRHEFACVMISSGLLCDEDVRWVSFHGAYDLGCLTKLLIVQPLPEDEKEFDFLVKKFFPSLIDVKYLIKTALKMHATGQFTPSDSAVSDFVQKLDQKTSLENAAELLKIKRQGAAHQAGSDSLLTGKVFFEIRKKIFGDELSDEHLGKMWGLGNAENNPTGQNQSTPQHFQQLQENSTPNGGPFANGTPSTPNSAHVGLVNTPGHTQAAPSGSAIGPLTPGGGGGVFGAFQFNK